MISGIFHDGSGLGNQLHRYIATRCIAADKGYEFGMKNPEKFKGKAFIPLDMGKLYEELPFEFLERRENHIDGITDIREFDNRIHDIRDNTLVDGEFQDERYWAHHKEDIKKWLGLDKIIETYPEDLCIINVRGGEYKSNSNLLLENYWPKAVTNMRKVNPAMRFKVVTDDVPLAYDYFPDFEITHSFADDWLSIYKAQYLILSNSSFAVFPAWLNPNVKKIIAPMYWARHKVSDGYWAMKSNIYDNWKYQDKYGNLHEFKDKKELPGGFELF